MPSDEFRSMRSVAVPKAAMAFLLAFLLAAPATAASDGPLGPVSGLPIPRFVSLKTDRVNVRQGPTKEHGVAWIFQRGSLPVEITAEFETWRRIRDADGAEGWVYHSLLSGKRTVVVTPWTKEEAIELRTRAEAAAPVSALLEPGVLASVRACDGNWCRIEGNGFGGYLEQEKLWGVYPGENFD
jgi:SH3-like domain-containing protein